MTLLILQLCGAQVSLNNEHNFGWSFAMKDKTEVFSTMMGNGMKKCILWLHFNVNATIVIYLFTMSLLHSFSNQEILILLIYFPVFLWFCL